MPETSEPMPQILSRLRRYQAQGRYNPVGYLGGGSNKNNTMWVSVSWDPICQYKTSYIVDEDDCNWMLGTVLDGCDTNTITEKRGGQVRAYCSIWNITIEAGKIEIPPNGEPKRSVPLA